MATGASHIVLKHLGYEVRLVILVVHGLPEAFRSR